MKSVNKASEWWRTNRYTRRIRFRRILGIPIPYRESVYGNYFTKRRPVSENVVRVVKELQAAGQIPNLDSNSKILEPGCNVGSNLFHLHEVFGCQVYGFDISNQAIDLAQNRVFNHSPQSKLWTADFLQTDVLDQFGDEEFDLVLTVGVFYHPTHTSGSQPATAQATQ